MAYSIYHGPCEKEWNPGRGQRTSFRMLPPNKKSYPAKVVGGYGDLTHKIFDLRNDLIFGR